MWRWHEEGNLKMLILAIIATELAAFYLYFGYQGAYWERKKSANWRLNVSSTEGKTGPFLYGAKINRDIVRHHRGYRTFGAACAAVSVLLWIYLLATWLS
jgi:hypothetical protein